MEILASLDDINPELPSVDEQPVVEATSENTGLIQVNVARVVRAYLSATVDSATLMSWDQPTDTPETIRVIAGKLIAANLYFDFAARTSLVIDDNSFAQKRYDEAMEMLNKIVAGEIVIGPGAEAPATLGLDELDFHPVDDTDRAFTMDMEL
jgi:hypothetical protein